jgi:hypothetical protein
MVHGCYDADTLRNLKEIGIRQFGFDLRGRSPNLIPFYHLKDFLKDLGGERIHLIFENDKPSTVLSFLNLLGDYKSQLTLEFRDIQSSVDYDAFKTPYYWFYQPSANWRDIFEGSYLKGVILPLAHQDHYQALKSFWEIIESKGLDVYIHAANFKEALKLQKDPGLRVSIDLNREIECGFRRVDQSLLRREILEIF